MKTVCVMKAGSITSSPKKRCKELFPYAQEAIDNTQKIADRCNVEIVFGEKKLPKYDVPDGFTSWEYLNKLCYEGLERRYPGDDARRSVNVWNTSLALLNVWVM